MKINSKKDAESYLKKNIWKIIITVVLMIVLFSIGKNKCGFHTDEILTFHLANCQYNQSLGVVTPEIIDGKKYAGEKLWTDYMAVQPGHKFDYKNVWANQAADVHPPLYYCLIHTIASFFPNRCEPWMGLSLNVLLAMIVFWQMRWLFGNLLKNKRLATIFSLLFLFSVGFINSISFFRMYVLLMVWTNALVILLMNTEPSSNDKTYYLKLYLIVLAGMMTQYYFSIFTCFICIVYAVYVIQNRNYKKFFYSTLTIITSVVTGVLVFPAMIKHIFQSGRGKEAFNNIHFGGFLEHLKIFLETINKQLFAGRALVILLFILGFTIIDFYVIKKHRPESDFIKKYLLIFVPTGVYCLFIAKLAPYQDIRYLMNILGLVYIVVVGLVYYILKDFAEKKTELLVVIFFLILGSMGYKNGIPNFRLSEKENLKKLSELGNISCIYLYDENYKWNIAESFLELKELDDISFYEIKNDNIVINTDAIIVYVAREDDHTDAIARLMENNSRFLEKTKLFRYGSETVYYLH